MGLRGIIKKAVVKPAVNKVKDTAKGVTSRVRSDFKKMAHPKNKGK